MKNWLLRIVVPLAVCHPFAVHADAPAAAKGGRQDPFAPPQDQAAAPASGARPSDEAIRAAVRAVLQEMPESPLPATGSALSGGAYREFERKFSEAEKPHCMGPNALKHQPHSITTKNWNVGVSGLFALPFWGAAIMRGKCSWSR
ncbi:hypothetical protein [Massilia sp. X63]|uniref:hypothetical protein n=1 Tax=Massilia sp. X63 TaxID=3237285 RepID=UPI0034DCDA1B